MKEFIDQLISRLEEESYQETVDDMDSFGDIPKMVVSINKAKGIVNQLAEEYNNESVKGDLISRSALIEVLTAERRQDRSRAYAEHECDLIAGTIAMCTDFVKAMPTVYNDGWIPCGERLPIDEEYIIRSDGVEFYKHMLTTTNDVDLPICVGWYDREEEKWFDLEGFAFYPIAWQPLPPKYEPKGE